MRRRDYLISAVATGGLLFSAGCLGSSDGDDYPSDDVRWVIPWSSGGGTDRTTRQLIELVELESEFTFVADNVTGSGGANGMIEISRSESDGYTIGTIAPNMVILPQAQNVELHPDNFEAVAQYNFDAAAVTVHEDAPFDAFDEFISYAEANPGEIKFGSGGVSSAFHLAGEGLGYNAGIELKHIPYDGIAPATTAVLNGEIDVTTGSVPEVFPQVRDGPLEVLAVMSEERHPLVEDAPTVIEGGIDWTAGVWRGVVAPSETPEELIERLEEELTAVIESEQFEDYMEENGFGIRYRDSTEFGEFMRNQYDDYGAVIDSIEFD
jgi:tripartite-type tricarboxylate transporter receptor subunit TctC